MSDEITTITKRAAALLKAGCDPAALGDALKLFDPLEYGSATVESEARGFIRSRQHFQVQPVQEPESQEKSDAPDPWDLDHASVDELAEIVAKLDSKAKPERSEPEVDSDSEEALAAAAGGFPATYSKGGW